MRELSLSVETKVSTLGLMGNTVSSARSAKPMAVARTEKPNMGEPL